MPNWVTTTMNVLGGKDADKLMKLAKYCKENDKNLFNEIIPRPKTYDLYDTTNYTTDKDVLKNKLEIGKPLGWDGDVVTEEYFNEFAKAEKEQVEKYGALGWYDWDCKNWGTKWGACELFVDSSGTIEFMTAWSLPEPILEAIAKQYDVMIDGSFEEEGNFHGNFSIAYGKFDVEYLDGSGYEDEEE